MGYIKEPEGIDFVIQSLPLTDLERTEISEFIKNRKLKNKQISKRTTGQRKTKIKAQAPVEGETQAEAKGKFGFDFPRFLNAFEKLGEWRMVVNDPARTGCRVLQQ